MTDHVGLWEHARYTTPRPEHGYCTDERAAHCSAVSSIPLQSSSGSPGSIFGRGGRSPTQGVSTTGERTSVGRRDRVDDSQVVPSGAWARPPDSDRRSGCVERHWDCSSGRRGSPRGRPEPTPSRSWGLRVLTMDPEHAVARTGAHSWASVLHLSDDPGWPVPEPRLAYDNPRIPEALMRLHLTRKRPMVEDGLRLLEWLMAIETARPLQLRR